MDDVAIYCSSRSPAQAGQFAAEEANRVIRWLADNTVPVEPAKTEFLRLAKGQQTDSEPIRLESHPEPIRPSASVRYLGVWLDPTLKFKIHAQKVANRGQRLANCMKRLHTTLQGLPPAQAQKVARACGTATVMYAAEAWWPGKKRVSASTKKEVSTNSRCLEDILDKPIKALARAVVPAMKTAPNSAVLREAGLFPTSVWTRLDKARAAARWAAMPDNHPVIERLAPLTANNAHCKPPPPTRLQRKAELPASPPRPRPLEEPTLQREKAKPKKEAAREHIKAINITPVTTRLVYTHGSKQGDKTSWAWVEQFPGTPTPAKERSGALARAEVFDAEVVAIHRAISSATKGPPRRTRVFSDNLAAVESCKHRPAPSSQKEAIKVRELLNKRKEVTLEWCPGHSNIPGNENADTAAKRALGNEPEPGRPTLAWTRAQAKNKKNQIVQEWWSTAAPGSYREKGLGPYPDAQGLNRRDMARLVAYRTGHGRFASHFTRFNIEADTPECECGAILEPRHLVQCPRRKKVVEEAKAKFNLANEEEAHAFFLGKGYKGIGAREWFPRLFK